MSTAVRRIAIFQSLLREAGCDAALLLNPPDIFYLAGTKGPANLLVPADASLPATLFVRRARDFVEEDVAALGFPPAWIVDGGSFREIAARLREMGLQRGMLGTSEDKLPTSLFRAIGRALPEWVLGDIAGLILEQRSVKDAEEIATMRRACALFAAGHEALLRTARPGVSELEVSLAAYSAMRLAGHEEFLPMRRWDATLPASGIIVAGDNLWRIAGHAYTVTGVGISRGLRFGASRRPLQAGDLIVFDMPSQFAGYHGDTARTYVVGSPSPEQLHAYVACEMVYQATIGALRPGISAADLHSVARDAAAETPYGPYFMGYGTKQGAYIGHSTGIEQDEQPLLAPGIATTIRPGMTLAIEPKFIIPGFGAVNVEDTWLVTEQGCEVLTTQARELFVVG